MRVILTAVVLFVTLSTLVVIINWKRIVRPIVFSVPQVIFPVPVLPILPVLTVKNKDHYFDWHTYYKRVYGSSIVKPVDLNTFTFFYWFSPLGKRVRTIHALWDRTPVTLNTPWLGTDGTPEGRVSEVGFFVRRPILLPYFSRRRVEVMRVNTASTDFEEDALLWFFGVTGSGIFVDVPPELLVMKQKSDLYNTAGVTWPQDTSTIEWELNELPKIMDEMRLKMIILSESSDYCPRTEVIVRNKSGKRVLTCTDIKLYKGECSCKCSEALDYLNCTA